MATLNDVVDGLNDVISEIASQTDAYITLSDNLLKAVYETANHIAAAVSSGVSNPPAQPSGGPATKSPASPASQVKATAAGGGGQSVLGALAQSAQQAVQALGGLAGGAGRLASAFSAVAGLAASVVKTLAAAAEGVGAFLKSLGGIAVSAAGATAVLTALAASALPGGFEVLGQVFEYLVATVGQALAPAFVALLAGVLTVADALASALKPSAESTQGAFDALVDATTFLVKTFLNVIDGIVVAFSVFKEAWRKEVMMIGGIMAELGEMLHLVPKGTAAAYREDARREDDTEGRANRARILEGTQSIQKRNSPEGTAAIRQNVLGNVDSILKAMQQSLGSKGNVGYAGIGDVRSQLQVQSFQSDIDMRKLRLGADILEVMKTVARNTKNGGNGPPAVGD